jgi:translation initiation factor IF-1
LAVDELAGAHFEGTRLKEVVTEVEGHDAYRVELVDGQLRETRIPARLLD